MVFARCGSHEGVAGHITGRDLIDAENVEQPGRQP